MKQLERRVRRLEQQAQADRFDPRRLARIAGAAYDAGEPLSEGLEPRDRRFAVAFYDMLSASDPANWWDRDLPPVKCEVP